MKRIEDLEPEQQGHLLRTIQTMLYWDFSRNCYDPQHCYTNPFVFPAIDQVFRKYGLAPESVVKVESNLN